MHQSTRAGRNPRPEKVEAVLAAARKLFLTFGFSNTTTDMVQKESGVQLLRYQRKFICCGN